MKYVIKFCKTNFYVKFIDLDVNNAFQKVYRFEATRFDDYESAFLCCLVDYDVDIEEVPA